MSNREIYENLARGTCLLVPCNECPLCYVDCVHMDDESIRKIGQDGLDRIDKEDV